MQQNDLEFTEYEGPKYPAARVNERMLIAAFIKHREVFQIINAIGLRDWFFADPLSNSIYREAQDRIKCKGFHSLMTSVTGGANERLKGAILRLIEQYDADYYMKDLNEFGEAPFCSLLSTHINERRLAEWKDISGKMQRKLFDGQDVGPEYDSLAALFSAGSIKQDLTTREIYDRMSEKGPQRAITTGIENIDKSVKIVEGGQLIVLGGESSAGKTTLANQIVTNVLLEGQGKVRYFSTETSEELLGWRFCTHIQRIESCSWSEAGEIWCGFGDLALTSEYKDLDEITEDIRERHARGDGLKVVVVDYLQNMSIKNCYNNTEIAERCIMRLHELAQELRLVVIVLSQLTKEGSGMDKVKGKPIPPTMNSFRGAAQIGNSADICLINQFTTKVDEIEHGAPRDVNVYVVKSKQGYQCILKCIFEGRTFTFTERDDSE